MGSRAPNLGKVVRPATSPVDVVGLGASAIDLALGESHTCAVLVNGALKCWGANYSSIPVTIAPFSSGVSAVGAGWYHPRAVSSASGGLRCWGFNSNGQNGEVPFTHTVLREMQVSDSVKLAGEPLSGVSLQAKGMGPAYARPVYQTSSLGTYLLPIVETRPFTVTLVLNGD